MKMLHVLVGYLTVIALPYPFAFASLVPLAIHYDSDWDGYVNSTTTQNAIDGALMEHILGTIKETCQTVITHRKSHCDSALMKRVPGDIQVIEARQEGYVPDVEAITVVIAAVLIAMYWIGSDNPKREDFTQTSITKMISKWPNFNWVICHSPYSIAFDGVEGTDYGHTHHELKISFGRTIGFDLYYAKSGTFYRYGDGGFINWAYNGNIVGTDDHGATVHFGTPS